MQLESDKDLDWATWPWNQCPAVYSTHFETAHCDLRKKHKGFHVAERGMYNITWIEDEF